MKSPVLYTLILCVAIGGTGIAGETADVAIFFSPHGGCEATIINAIDTASESINVAAYSFSSKPIARALYAASKRGITVRVLLDRRQPKMHYSMADDLLDNGLTIRIDRRETMMHMKLILIDDDQIICGSYNFSASAENRNAEILTVIKSKPLASKAGKNFAMHWGNSDIYNRNTASLIKKGSTEKPTTFDNVICPLKTSNYVTRKRIWRTYQWSNSQGRCFPSRHRVQ